jgi:hypothetical protein
MPLMPEDFDLRFNNCAHPLLQLEESIAPGMPVGIDGMSLDGPLAATIPAFDVAVTAVFR